MPKKYKRKCRDCGRIFYPKKLYYYLCMSCAYEKDLRISRFGR